VDRLWITYLVEPYGPAIFVYNKTAKRPQKFMGNSIKKTIEEAVKSGADLLGADLQGADLRGADLQDAKNADYAIAKTRILPEGDIIGWKKCRNGVIVKLLIPKEAKRSHSFGRKCRAEFADVLEVIGDGPAVSSQKDDFVYEVGKRVTPDKWDDNWLEECSHGIHFFITRVEAENY
jgi:hypothetical protein